MCTLFLIRGLPGAGKTTLAKELGAMFAGLGKTAVVVAADDFMVDREGNYDFKPENLHYAHRECLRTAAIAMGQKADAVIVHNTFTTQKEMTPYEDLAVDNNYRIVRLVVERSHDNINVHGVPSEKIEQMRDRFTLQLT